MYFCVLFKSILNWTERKYTIFMTFVIHSECVSRFTWSYNLFLTMRSIIISPFLSVSTLPVSLCLCLSLSFPLFRFHSHVGHSALICEQISSTLQPKKSLLLSIYLPPAYSPSLPASCSVIHSFLLLVRRSTPINP